MAAVMENGDMSPLILCLDASDVTFVLWRGPDEEQEMAM